MELNAVMRRNLVIAKPLGAFVVYGSNIQTAKNPFIISSQSQIVTMEIEIEITERGETVYEQNVSDMQSFGHQKARSCL